MLIPIWFILFVGGVVGFLIYGVVRFYRETSLLTENLEFFLRQRTLVHNQDKAKLAIYQTKIDKLEKRVGQNGQAGISATDDKEVLRLRRENQDLQAQIQTHEKEFEILSREHQGLRQQFKDLETRYEQQLAEREQALQMHRAQIQEQKERLEQLQQVEADKLSLERRLSQLETQAKSGAQPEAKPRKPRSPRKKSAPATSPQITPQPTLISQSELGLELKVAEQFEEKMRERAQKDYNDILALEKQILRLKLHLEGQSTAFQAVEAAYQQPQPKQSQQVSSSGLNQGSPAPVAEVREEVESLKRVLLQDIRPQMSQYMLELQGLAQRLKETRQSFFETELSRRAFAGLSVKDVA